MSVGKKKPAEDNVARDWNSMLQQERLNRLRIAEEQYVKTVVGTPMNRKQRREALRNNKVKGPRK